MKRVLWRQRSVAMVGFALASLLLAALPAAGRVLDNFNDNVKTAWTDFTFVPGFGIPTETGGQFRFVQPPAGQAIFSASQKTSEVFELKEGRTLEFRADIVEAGAKDSFAVLAFIPNTGGNSPGTLAGYGFAKSTTDVLITKGINKYFVADDSDAAELRNDNITLVLTMRVVNGSVTVTAKVLDKLANNAVMWEETVVDTPNADALADGTDDPAAPYLTTGFFTLYCYQDFDPGMPEDPYQVIYDNAEVIVMDREVLDNFNDNTKTAWTDFTFVPGFGIPVETGGQFRFEQPGAGQPIFSASQKTSRQFGLVEGERLIFEVDVVQAGGSYSYPVVAFIPNTGGNSPGTLAGYGFAKSTTDVVITKGINKYFTDDDSAAASLLPNENITLSLSLEVKNGNVIIIPKVLDKSAGNAVVWERQYIDTPAADVLEDGTDDPAAPFITTGFFTLYLYQNYNAGEDPYRAYFDNAVVHATPVAGNTAPIIADVQPMEYSSFLPASTQISFTVRDDKALPDNKIQVNLNGTVYTTANGLVLGGTPLARTATLGGLAGNVNYVAVLGAEDSDGVAVSRNLYFDTFLASDITLEVEDYNFSSGSFIDNPELLPEGTGPVPTSYSMQMGTIDVDYSDTREYPDVETTPYRWDDNVRMQRTLDIVRAKFEDAGGAMFNIYDYDVGDIAAGEWMNYTHTFPAGWYEVYLRQAVANMAGGASVLELVTGNRTQPNQTTKLLGSFLGERTGFQYRNFALTDGTGENVVALQLSGVTTLRLRHITPDAADGGRFQNYLVFRPVSAPGKQRAFVASVAPLPKATNAAVAPAIQATIVNRDTSVQTGTVQLTVNGSPVTATVTPQTGGAQLTATLSPPPPPGVNTDASVTFTDSEGAEIVSSWSFVLDYKTVDAANRQPGPGTQRGFTVRVVQAPAGTPGFTNNINEAEAQLAPNSTIPKYYDLTTVQQRINFSQDGPGSANGQFPDDALVPGLVPANGSDEIAMEILTYLELTQGSYRFGVTSDDGYKIMAGSTPGDMGAPILAVHASGTANDETFDFVVPATGFYPFRMVWFEHGGGAHVEWYSVNTTTGARTLINDPGVPSAVKAWVGVEEAPAIVLQSAVSLATAFADEAGATIDTGAKRVTVPMTAGAARFYRLLGPTELTITSIAVDGANLVLTYTE